MKEFIFHKMERKRETMCTCSRGKKQQRRSEFEGFRHRGQKEISLLDMGGKETTQIRRMRRHGEPLLLLQKGPSSFRAGRKRVEISLFRSPIFGKAHYVKPADRFLRKERHKLRREFGKAKKCWESGAKEWRSVPVGNREKDFHDPVISSPSSLAKERREVE